jgi:hypothetical protein
MGEEDMIKWIHENWRSYAYRHILGLLVQTLGSSLPVLNNRKLNDATHVIDGLYEIMEAKENNKLTNGSAQKGPGQQGRRDSVSSMIAQTFRR